MTDRPEEPARLRKSIGGRYGKFPEKVGSRLRDQSRQAWPALVVLVGLLGAWQAAVDVWGVPAILLPPPSDVAVALAALLPTLLGDAAVTATTAALGLAAGCLAGGVLAFGMVRSRAATRTVLPFVVALRIAPLVAIAPLVFLWFGRGILPRATLVATLTVFPMTVATLDGLRSTPPEYLALARSVAASPGAVFLRVRVPAAAPSVFAGLELAATLSIIGAVVAEFVTLRAGIGYRVFVTADRLQTTDSFAALAVLSALGIGFYLAPRAIARATGFHVDSDSR